jgi:hypothetical protein
MKSGIDCINFSQDRDKWNVLVDTKIKAGKGERGKVR